MSGRASNLQIQQDLIWSLRRSVFPAERRRNPLFEKLAERVGFEPTIRFPVYTLSKRAP